MTRTVLIDALSIGGQKMTGVGRYTYELISRFPSVAPDLSFDVLVPPRGERNWDLSSWEEANNLNLQTVKLPAVGPKRQIYYLLKRQEYDLYHSTTSYLPIGISQPSIVTIHDMKYVRNPDYFRGMSFLKRHYVSTLIKRSAKCADKVITVSKYTAEDLTKIYGLSDDDVKPIHLGPSELPSCSEHQSLVDGDYILTVGELRPHKNIIALVRAYNQLCSESKKPYPRLIIVGSDYQENKASLKEEIDEQYEPYVKFTGRVDDETLSCLYRDADVFAFPSKYEGFGLPLLEAMSCGTPVVASNKTAVPEVAGSAALFFEPDDHDTLKSHLKSLLNDSDLWTRHSDASVERYNQFSWEKTASRTISVYREHL